MTPAVKGYILILVTQLVMELTTIYGQGHSKASVNNLI